MKKKIFVSGLMAMIGVGLLTGSAMAASMPWDNLVNNYGYVASGDMDYWTPTDSTTNVTGTSLFQIEVEQASYESAFGLFINDGTNSPTKFEIFTKSQEPNQQEASKELVTFRDSGGVFEITKHYTDDKNDTNDQWVTFDSTFGFYYDVYQGGTKTYSFFTDNSLNTDDQGIEHIWTAYNSSKKSLYIYLDDQIGVNRDKDYTDMTVFADDLQPVPEPATMLLFGAGLAGIAGLHRRKN